MNFKFLNTNYNLSTIKVGISVEDNEFLKKFDKNCNSVFDADELADFMNELAPYLDDNTLDNNEAVSFFSKILGITTTEAQKQLNDDSNEVEIAFKTLIQEQAKRDAVKYSNSEIDQALEIYSNAMGGCISKACNSIKEFFNADYAGDKIYRQLVRNKASAMMLEKSNDKSLTVKEYAEMKIDLLESLLGGEKLSSAEREAIRDSAKCLDLKGIDSLIEKLVNVEDNGYESLKAEIIKNLKNSSQQSNNREIGFTKIDSSSLGTIMSLYGDKKLNFEQVFEYENGVKFDAENVNVYNEKQRDFDRIAGLNNRIAHQYNDLEEVLKENNPEKLKETIKLALDNLFGNNEEAKSEFIKNLGINPLYNFSDDEAVIVAKKLQEELLKQSERLLDGKSLEEHIEVLGKAKDLAFGKKHNVDLASRFAESQENWVEGTKIAVAGVGFIATLAGGPISLVGVALSVAGGAGVSFVEEASKSGDIPADKQKEILKELAVSGALNLAGFGSGAISSNLGKLVASKCPKLVAAIAEYGSDAVMSIIADAAITGEVDLKGEGIAQLINVATGIVAHRKVTKQKTKIIADVNTKQAYETKPTTSIIKFKKTELESYIKNLAQKSSSTMSENEINDLIEELYKLRKRNKSLLKDIEEAQIFKLIEDGKLGFDTLKNLEFDKNARLSKNMINDYKKMANGEPFIKNYGINIDKTKIISETKNGEVVEVGNKLFLNDNGSLTEVHLTKEKYLELFPPAKRFDIKQNGAKTAGNCWFLETATGLYNNDNTRNQILKLFRQDGNDVFIKLPNSKIEMKFSEGKLPNDKLAQKYLSNSPKWVQLLEYTASCSRGENSLEKRVLANFDFYKEKGVVKEINGKLIFDYNKHIDLLNVSESLYGPGSDLSRLYAGTAKEATQILTNCKSIQEYNIHSLNAKVIVNGDKLAKKELKKIKKEIKEKLRLLEGKSGYSINTAITCHAFSVTRIENGKIYLVDPYNTSIEIEFDIDDFVDNYCNHLEISYFN